MPFETMIIHPLYVEQTSKEVTEAYERVADLGGKIVAHHTLDLVLPSRGKKECIMLVAEIPEDQPLIG